jgi:hypothetical protein
VTAKRILAQAPHLLSEAEFSGLVVEVARFGGWTHRYHTFSSKRSTQGFPDWFFFRPSSVKRDEDQPSAEILIVELKTEVGKLSEKQQSWIEALQLYEEAVGVFYGAGDPYDESTYWRPFRVRVWRPSDWDEIVETLTGKRPREEAA